MGVNSISVENCHDGITKNGENKKVKRTNSSLIDNISVICINDASSKRKGKKEVLTEDDETAFISICKIVGFTVGIVGFSLFSTVPWTVIPRTNSIIFQSSWMEIMLPSLSNSILFAGSNLQNLTIWTKERSFISIQILLMLTLAHFAPFVIFHILAYIIWCICLGYNHPLPYLGMLQISGWIAFVIALRFLLPSRFIANEDNRKKICIYIVYLLWCFLLAGQNEVLSYVFANLPEPFQFLVAFMIAACRELDKKARIQLVTKVMGTLDEPGSVLLSIITSVFYGSFVASRIAGATGATVFCIVSIDFALQSRMTLQLIKEYNKVKENDTENGENTKSFKATKLIVAELIEGFTPMIYAICMAMAYYGPNSGLFFNIKSNFGGQPIEDINYVFGIMAFLYSIDTISAAINSIVLWKVTKINMLKEFGDVLSKYWLFMVIKFSFYMSVYFGSLDVNFGIDSRGEFMWITPEGRLKLIRNLTNITGDDKSMSFANITIF